MRNEATGPRRASCVRCLRPASACICRWIAPLASRTELLILQHPLETGNAKNSGRLLHLSVAPSVLAVGERFDHDQLHAMLHAGGRRPVLLYPEPEDVPASSAAPDCLDAASMRLVVIDATWRKSRKMLHLNEGLRSLPRYVLRAVPPSRYRIRKAHALDQLSTLEATATALAQLDPAGADWSTLFSAFDGFVSEQAVRAGRD